MASKRNKDSATTRRTFTRSSAQLKWTFEMKLAVDVLHEDFDFSPPRRERIFFSLFEDHIKLCGFAEAVPAKRLTVQWREKNKAKPPKDWIRIGASIPTPQDAAARELWRVRIRDVARGEPPSHRPASSSQALAIPLASPTPLSRRAPIGYWKAGENEHEGEDEDEDEAEEPPAKRRRSLRSVGQVQTHRQLALKPPPRRRAQVQTPQARTPARTPPTKKSTVKGSSSVKRPYPRPDDYLRGQAPLQLTEAQHQIAKLDLIPIQEQLAHPVENGLLYRYWKDDPRDFHNSSTGFTARFYADSVRMWQRPPHCTALDWVSLYKHIDRHLFDSPFISTSNALWWILRVALKENENGVLNGRISVIDMAALDKRSVFHVNPYHKQLQKKFVFHDGAWHYTGLQEFVVWREIPGKAIIKTFNVDDLVNMVDHTPPLRQTLALPILKQAKAYRSNTGGVLKELRDRGLLLSATVVASLSTLLAYMGFGPHSSTDQISHIIADIIQGWGIKTTKKDDREWASLAAVFATSLAQHTNAQFQVLEEWKLRQGFLDGVRYGSTTVFNAKHTLKGLESTARKSRSIGLASSARILANELDAMKLMLISNEKREQRLLETHRNRNGARFIAQREYEEENVDDYSGGQADGEDEDDDDFGRFEMGEDGFVL